MENSNKFITGFWYLGTSNDHADKLNIKILVEEEYSNEWVSNNLHTYNNEEVYSVEDVRIKVDGKWFDGRRIVTQQFYPAIGTYSSGGYLGVPEPASWRELRYYLIAY